MSNWYEAVDAPDARRWEYEEGDLLVGSIVAIGEYSGEYGTSQTVTVDPDKPSTEAGKALKEQVVVYASPTVLARKLKDAGLRVGDKVAIKYHGETSAKDGRNTYKNFGVAVDRAQGLAAQAASDGADW